MKNLPGKLFNLLIYINWILSSGAFGYAALPEEYQVADMSLEALLVTGGTTFLLGASGLYYKHVLGKKDIEYQSALTIALEQVLNTNKEVVEVKKNYQSLQTEVLSLKNELSKTNNLIKIELNAKLSNPLIDEEVKKMIEGVLNED